MPTRRKILCAAASIPIVGANAVWAQQYPEKAIRILLSTGTGTAADATARYFTNGISKKLNVPVIIENRPGAGGLLAYTYVAKMPPDGYTIMLGGLPHHLLPLFSDGVPPFDTVKDFTPIARVVRAPLALVVRADSQYKTIDDLLQALKSPDSKLTYSAQGKGSSAHLCAVMLNAIGNTTSTQIQYKDTTGAVLDVAAGRVDFTCQGSSSVLALIQAGRLRALAVTSPKRWESLPDVPSTADTKLPGFEIWPGLDFLGPANLPDAIVQTLSDAIMPIAQTAEYKAFCNRQSLLHEAIDHRSLKDVIAQEAAGWKRVAAMARNS